MLAAFFVFLAAWFVSPIDQDHVPEESREMLYGVVPGWFVFRWTFEMMLLSDPSGEVSWVWWKLLGLTSVTNLVVPSLIVCVASNRFWLPIGAGLAGFAALDTIWMSELPLSGRGGLRAGYYIWLGSVLTMGLASLACAHACARAPAAPRADVREIRKELVARSLWSIAMMLGIAAAVVAAVW